ncbi:hypothetical protein EDD85DRAFT_798470 [Armillaria nabsnona]|nr:hypothetical protein EDD85DRAFT_798470 [Armillaria nabsnona]
MSITELTGRSTWTHWLRGVKSVATIHSVLPHILEDPPDFVSPNPLCRASYPPVMDKWSTPQDWEVHMVWQKQDAIMMHILTSRLSDDVSAVVPMVDDLEEYGDLFTARDMLARLRKYFGLGDHIQANAACEALHNFTVDMHNIPKYVQKWRSTILALCAEHYPIGYIDTVLNFMRNLPEEDHGWFMSLRQEVT